MSDRNTTAEHSSQEYTYGEPSHLLHKQINVCRQLFIFTQNIADKGRASWGGTMENIISTQSQLGDELSYRRIDRAFGRVLVLVSSSKE